MCYVGIHYKLSNSGHSALVTMLMFCPLVTVVSVICKCPFQLLPLAFCWLLLQPCTHLAARGCTALNKNVLSVVRSDQGKVDRLLGSLVLDALKCHLLTFKSHYYLAFGVHPNNSSAFYTNTGSIGFIQYTFNPLKLHYQ